VSEGTTRPAEPRLDIFKRQRQDRAPIAGVTSLPPEEPLADPLAEPAPADDRIGVDVPQEDAPPESDKIEGY
jgi:hypothetical protein